MDKALSHIVVGSGISLTLYASGALEVAMNRSASALDGKGNYRATCNPSQAHRALQWAERMNRLKQAREAQEVSDG